MNSGVIAVVAGFALQLGGADATASWIVGAILALGLVAAHLISQQRSFAAAGPTSLDR